MLVAAGRHCPVVQHHTKPRLAPDHTRIIRQAYYEHPSYVPLVRRAYERWYDLDTATREWIGLVSYRVTGRSDALFPGPE